MQKMINSDHKQLKCYKIEFSTVFNDYSPNNKEPYSVVFLKPHQFYITYAVSSVICRADYKFQFYPKRTHIHNSPFTLLIVTFWVSRCCRWYIQLDRRHFKGSWKDTEPTRDGAWCYWCRRRKAWKWNRCCCYIGCNLYRRRTSFLAGIYSLYF